MATASAAQIGAFIEMMAPLAMEQAKRHGGRLFASVCIAQAAHETGWGGGSSTMMRYNAPFGIKVGASAYHFGTAWKGASYNTKTKEYYGGSSSPTVIRDNFRAYSSLSDAVEDYMDMLCTASRYRAGVGCATPEESIRAIGPIYATGPSYAEKIIQIINSKTYNLKKYDAGKVYKDISPELIKSVILGEYGNGQKRQQALEKAGYRYEDVRGKINELYKLSLESKKGLEKKTGDYLECAIMLMML